MTRSLNLVPGFYPTWLDEIGNEVDNSNSQLASQPASQPASKQTLLQNDLAFLELTRPTWPCQVITVLKSWTGSWIIINIEKEIDKSFMIIQK